MRLRTSFILLTVGSAVIPPIMIILTIVFGVLGTSETMIPVRYYLQRELTAPGRTGESSVQTVLGILADRDRDYPLFVLDGRGIIRYPAARSGERGELKALLDERKQQGDRSSAVYTLPDETGGTGHIILPDIGTGLLSKNSGIGLLFPALFVLFTGLGSLLIIRSINNSIVHLERATRRIADGDLEFELDIGGRDRLASLTRSFDTMRRRLKEQSDRSSRFLMGISHDLKTPLSSISGYIDAIRDGYADTEERLQKYTSIIQAKTQLLESRIAALIDYAKNETRDWKVTLDNVCLADFLKEFAALTEAEAHARRFDFTSLITIDAGLQVAMDPDMIVRALDNIVENAFMYAAPESEIRFNASQQKDTVVIAVENTGPVISPKDLPHIFDPLYRASGSRSGNGFGLGLSTVKSVIVSHGWDIDAASASDGRTSFTIRIPAAVDE